MEPSREYLAKIGELAYLVAEFEWQILDDIRLTTTGLDAGELLGLSTGAIGRALEALVPDLRRRPNVQNFVAVSAKALLDIASRRNAVLHARPGTTSAGNRQLLRLRERRDGKVERFWIDDTHLDKQISAIGYWTRRVERTRELPLD